ncbi:MAG: hypothetical protein MR425_03005 [Lachnospiraceae bacterium]|nr:hypothetical protein [Lachnospiraceae bacterium]
MIHIFLLVLTILIFLMTTAGFFLTDGKTERIYGALSIISLGCAVVQLGILFI